MRSRRAARGRAAATSSAAARARGGRAAGTSAARLGYSARRPPERRYWLPRGRCAQRELATAPAARPRARGRRGCSGFAHAGAGVGEQPRRLAAPEQDGVVVERAAVHGETRQRVPRVVLDHRDEPAGPDDPRELRGEFRALGRRHVVEDGEREREVVGAVVEREPPAVVGPVGALRVRLPGALDHRRREVDAVHRREPRT